MRALVIKSKGAGLTTISENPGKLFLTIVTADSVLVSSKRIRSYFNETRHLPAVRMGLDAINPESNRRAREQFAKYLEQFCSYFTFNCGTSRNWDRGNVAGLLGFETGRIEALRETVA